MKGLLLYGFALSLAACSGESPDEECIPGESRADVVCSSAGEWVAQGKAAPTTPPPETGMATEVNGECVFNPGTYVATYRVLDATASCATVSTLPDEYITVTDGGSIVGNTEVPQGCIDGVPIVEGCFVAFDRDCTILTDSGRIESHVEFQFEYAEGSGLVTVMGRLYSGAVLTDGCVYTQEATIRRR